MGNYNCCSRVTAHKKYLSHQLNRSVYIYITFVNSNWLQVRVTSSSMETSTYCTGDEIKFPEYENRSSVGTMTYFVSMVAAAAKA